MTTLTAPLPAERLNRFTAATQDGARQLPRPDAVCSSAQDYIDYGTAFYRSLLMREQAKRFKAARAATKRRPDAPRY